MDKFYRKVVLLSSLKDYLEAQEKEIMSAENIHYTKENYNIKNPTKKDLIRNYIEHKGNIIFRKMHTYPGQPRNKKFLER